MADPGARAPLRFHTSRGTCPRYATVAQEPALDDTPVNPEPDPPDDNSADFAADDTAVDLNLPIPGYRLLAELGRGGQGVVFRALQLSLDRSVAIKVLHPRFLSDRKLRARFRKEAHVLAGLSHENVVAVIDRGTVGPMGYLVMELVQGETLAQHLRRGALEPPRALQVLDQIASGLDYCHERGLVIRDLKPSNLLLNERGVVKIADFGLAKITASGGGELDTAITRSGQLFGTPRYMSPEQAEGRSDLDHRTDLYSLGLISYELFTGGLPPHHLPPLSERVPDLPVDVDAVVNRMLDPVPGNRYQSAGEFVATLKDAVLGRVPPGPIAHDAPTITSGLTRREVELARRDRRDRTEQISEPIGRAPRASGPLAEVALALVALVLSVALPTALTAPPEPPREASPVWIAPEKGGKLDTVVARFSLPGPWWLRRSGTSVLVLSRDGLGEVSYLARIGPEQMTGLAPLVERFPLDVAAAELAPDGLSMVVAGRDRTVARVGLDPGLPVAARTQLEVDARAIGVAADGSVAVATRDATILLGADLKPRARGARGTGGTVRALAGGRWLLADPDAVAVLEPDGALRGAPRTGAAGVTPPGGPTWLLFGWEQHLDRLGDDGAPAGSPVPCADVAPGPLAVAGDFAVVPVRGGVATISLADGRPRTRVPYELPLTAVMALPDAVWLASRHGDQVALIR